MPQCTASLSLPTCPHTGLSSGLPWSLEDTEMASCLQMARSWGGKGEPRLPNQPPKHPIPTISSPNKEYKYRRVSHGSTSQAAQLRGREAPPQPGLQSGKTAAPDTTPKLPLPSAPVTPLHSPCCASFPSEQETRGDSVGHRGLWPPSKGTELPTLRVYGLTQDPTHMGPVPCR